MKSAAVKSAGQFSFRQTFFFFYVNFVLNQFYRVVLKQSLEIRRKTDERKRKKKEKNKIRKKKRERERKRDRTDFVRSDYICVSC